MDLARTTGRPASQLLRRAIREMVTGGPDFFDDGVALMAQAVQSLARLERRLAKAAAVDEELDELRELLQGTRSGFAEQVRRSRQRWAPILDQDRVG